MSNRTIQHRLEPISVIQRSLGSATRQALAEVRNLRCQARQGVSEVENPTPGTRLLGEAGGRSNRRTSAAAAVQRCACDKETENPIAEEKTPEASEVERCNAVLKELHS